jgi:hypothetical protein
MRRFSVLFVVVWMILGVSQGASAQFLPGISEITGYGGATFNGTNETTAGAALAINVTPHLGIEGEVGAIFADDEIINVNVDLVFNFGSGTSLVIPYLIGGAGFLNNGGTDIALNGGAGFKLFIDRSIALRADFRGFFISVSGDVHDMERLYGGIEVFF